MSEEIRAYWERRASENVALGTATTNDIYLRELEARTCAEALTGLGATNGRVLDIGCGDGASTLAVARACPSLSFVGIDYSQNMIAAAQQRAAEERLSGRVVFFEGDVMNLKATCGEAPFSAALSMRCLINLSSSADQELAFARIAECLEPGGHYLAIENFEEGHHEMNRAREAIGLPCIPIRWHNLFFTEDKFIKWAARHFYDIKISNFSSSYYFATRVIYSKMCQMRKEEPNYQHDIHRLGVLLPEVGNFSPVRRVLMRRRPQEP
jgi:ubiquinone/menaquinone biosynthesis C-methylase UbiE